MEINILAFGQVAGVTGANFNLKDEVMDTDNLQILLQQRYPALAGMKYAIAVNKQMVHQNTPIVENTTIALLPPFSGG